MVASDGGVFSFGGAACTPPPPPCRDKPIEGMTATPDGKGDPRIGGLDAGAFAFRRRLAWLHRVADAETP